MILEIKNPKKQKKIGFLKLLKRIGFTVLKSFVLLLVFSSIITPLAFGQYSKAAAKHQLSIFLTRNDQERSPLTSILLDLKVDGINVIDGECSSITWSHVSDPNITSKLSAFNGKTQARLSLIQKAEATASKYNVQATCQFSGDTAPTAYTAQAAGNSPNDTTGLAGKDAELGLMGLLAQVVEYLIFALNSVLYWLVTVIFTPFIVALLSINPHSSEFSAVIFEGWQYFRDLMNVVFIVAMIVIGLATLFRVDKYSYRHLLVHLVIMALLINFSLVFARAVLGIADTLQAQFLPASADVINQLAHELIIPQNSILQYQGAFKGAFSSIVASAFYLIFGVGTFFAFGAICAFLVIRTIALWILLMLSPAAFGLRILPMTEHYAEEWLKEFLKYAFFTPILALFLRFAVVVANGERGFVQGILNGAIKTADQQNFTSFIQLALSNVLLLVVLYIGVYIAHHSGTFGANAVAHWAESMTKGTLSAVTYPAKHYAHSLYEDAQMKKRNATSAWMQDTKNPIKKWTGRLLNADVAWSARQHRLEHYRKDALDRASGRADQASTFFATAHKDHETGELVGTDLAQDVAGAKSRIIAGSKSFFDRDVEGSARSIKALGMAHADDPKYMESIASQMVALYDNGRAKDVFSKLIAEGVDGHGPIGDGRLNHANMTVLMDQLLGKGQEALKIRSEILSQAAKNKNFLPGIYTAYKKSDGTFGNGNDQLSPGALAGMNSAYQEYINASASDQSLEVNHEDPNDPKSKVLYVTQKFKKENGQFVLDHGHKVVESYGTTTDQNLQTADEEVVRLSSGAALKSLKLTRGQLEIADYFAKTENPAERMAMRIRPSYVKLPDGTEVFDAVTKYQLASQSQAGEAVLKASLDSLSDIFEASGIDDLSAGIVLRGNTEAEYIKSQKAFVDAYLKKVEKMVDGVKTTQYVIRDDMENLVRHGFSAINGNRNVDQAKTTGINLRFMRSDGSTHTVFIPFESSSNNTQMLVAEGNSPAWLPKAAENPLSLEQLKEHLKKVGTQPAAGITKNSIPQGGVDNNAIAHPGVLVERGGKIEIAPVTH